MIVCPVCQTDNHHLAIVCVSCGSYIQSKIDTLDLFATAWQLIESPKKAFHRIAMASHKNYILFLAGGAGIAFAFTVLWVQKIGDGNIPYVNILIAGFAVGPLLGVINLLLLALLQKLIARIFRIETKYKNALAIIAYAHVPIVLSVIFILPIEILTFGKYFFSTNPSPLTLKPFSYILLLGLDGGCFLWSLMLYSQGIRILYDISLRKAFAISTMTVAMFAVIIFLIGTGISSFQINTDADRYPTHMLFQEN
jgi:hypothetical protein